MFLLTSFCIAVVAAQTSLSVTSTSIPLPNSSGPGGPPPSVSPVPFPRPSAPSEGPPLSTPTQLVSANTTAYVESLLHGWGVAGVAVAIVASPQFKGASSVNASLTGGLSNSSSTLNAASFNGSSPNSTSAGSTWKTQFISFGNATSNTTVTNETIFSIGSNSKLFTALAIELLIANDTQIQGNGTANATLTLNTKVKDILPEWQLQDPYASDHVDLTDLLTMRSGLPRHDLSMAAIPPADAVANMRNLKPSTEIRQAWQYNNLHYVTLALVVSRLSGMSFENYVQTYILNPVGLKNTFQNSTAPASTGMRSDAYVSKNVNITQCLTGMSSVNISPGCFGTPVPIGWWTPTDGRFLAGAGSIASNAEDMAVWLRELLSPRVLPAGLVRDVGVGREAIGLPGAQGLSEQIYGFGQISYTYRGVHVVGHTGNVPGFYSSILRLPELGVGVAVLVSGEAPIYESISYRIIDDLLGFEPMDWKSLATLSLLGYLTLPKPPLNVTDPPVPFTSIAGNYSNPGYGPLSFRQVSPAELMTETYQPLGNLPLNLTGPVFVSDIDKVFANRVVMTHFTGPYFNVTALHAYPNVTSMVGVGSAVLTPQGIGLWGIWGQGPSVPPLPVVAENVEQACEVWFAKA